MNKPTREAAEKEYRYLNNFFRKAHRLDLLKAYLAQGEELKSLKSSMEAEYIERQAKHIQELVKENMELKAGSLRLEA